MGLSRNKVAVPEGAAGTPPFWSSKKKGDPPPNGDFKDRNKIKDKRQTKFSLLPAKFVLFIYKKEKEEAG